MLGEALGEEVRYEQIALGAGQGPARARHVPLVPDLRRYEPDVAYLRRLHPGLLTFRQWLEAGRLDLRKVEQKSVAA